MDKLKPCPFCGDKQHVTHVELSNGLHYVECERCGAAPHRLGAWDYETAVKYWNSVSRWIPCSEALPASICRVLVTTFAGNVGVAVFNPKKKRWYKNGEFYDLCLIIAWQPMPDAYEPPKEDET